jgi:UDP-glucose 4-epimerase
VGSSAPSLSSTQSEISRVVILGHTGFIGGHLHHHFKAHSPSTELVGLDFPDIDLTKPDDAERLKDVLDNKTALIVCAAIKKQMGDDLSSFYKNIQITVNICNVLGETPARRVIFFSSAAVYGESVHNTHIDEETSLQPHSFYGIGKMTSELLLRKVVSIHKDSTLLLLRPALIYGPGDQGGYGPTGFVKAASSGQEIVLWGDGSEKREFIFVLDVAKIVHALTFDSCQGTLNVVSGTSYTFLEALQIVDELIGLKKPSSTRPRTQPKADHGFVASRLRDLIPGIQFTALREGIRQTVQAQLQKEPTS